MEGMESSVFIIVEIGFWRFFSRKRGNPHPKRIKPHFNQFNPHPENKTPHLTTKSRQKIPPPKQQERDETYLLNLTRCSRSAFMTTDTELNAIAAPASHGAKNPAAAIGMPTEL